MSEKWVFKYNLTVLHCKGRLHSSICTRFMFLLNCQHRIYKHCKCPNKTSNTNAQYIYLDNISKNKPLLIHLLNFHVLQLSQTEVMQQDPNSYIKKRFCSPVIGFRNSFCFSCISIGNLICILSNALGYEFQQYEKNDAQWHDRDIYIHIYES